MTDLLDIATPEASPKKGKAKTAAPKKQNLPAPKLTTVPIDLVDEGNNARDYADPALSQERIRDFAFSDIRVNGIRNPLVMVEKEGGRYEVVGGHRRFRAASLLNKHNPDTFQSLPAIVHKDMPGRDKLLTMLADRNSAPLTPVGQAQVLHRLMDEEGLTQSQAADHLGVTVAYAGDLRLLATADDNLKNIIRREAISATEAVRLIKTYGETQATQIIDEALKHIPEEPVSVSAPEPSGEPASPKPRKRAAITKSKTDDIAGRLGAKPLVSEGKGKVKTKLAPAPAPSAPQRKAMPAIEALNKCLDTMDSLLSYWENVDSDREGFRQHIRDMADALYLVHGAGYHSAKNRAQIEKLTEERHLDAFASSDVAKARVA